MKKTYETPSLVIEQFDLQDPEIVAGSIYSYGGEGNPYGPYSRMAEF